MQPHRTQSRAVPYALFALFVIEIALFLDRNSIWFDESYTILLVEPHGYADIARRTSVDGHPPLFYWLVKPWLALFGSSAAVLRAQQALWMIAGVALWYRFFATRFSQTVGLVVLALLVTNPYVVHYAVEGRMYALGLVFAAATTLLVTSSARWRWVAYWPLAVAMLYTHYFLAFVIAAQFVWMLFSRERQGLRVWWLLVYGASIVAAFVPWIPYAVAQTEVIVTRGFWIGPVTPFTVVTYVLQTFAHVVDADARGWFLFPGSGLLVLVGILLVRGARTRSEYRPLVLCLAIVPPLCLFVLSCEPLRPIFHPRYVLFTLPALLGLVAQGILALPPSWRRVAGGAVIAVQLFGLAVFWHRGTIEHHQYYSMKRVAREVAQPIDGELPAVVVLGHMEFFDAKVVMRDQDVRLLRQGQPQFGGIEAVYYDKPDWYVFDLAEVKARHVWFIEYVHNGPYGFPSHWTELQRLKRGYVQYRLARVDGARL